MEFKIKIGNKYFAGFEEKESNGEMIGSGYKLKSGKVKTDSEGVSLSAIGVKSKVDSIIEQMRFDDIPKENITLEVVENS